ncbi:MAG: T9SS type A sorting domain-containing protein [Bacteroidota bacterium]
MPSKFRFVVVALCSVALFNYQPSNAQSFCLKAIADNGESDYDHIADIIETEDDELAFIMQNGYHFDTNMKTIVGKIDAQGDSVWLRRYDLMPASIATREYAQAIIEAPNKDLIFVSNFWEVSDPNRQGFSIARVDSAGNLLHTRYYTDTQLQATKLLLRPNGNVLVFGTKGSYLFAMLLYPDLDYVQALQLGHYSILMDVIELNGNFVGVTRSISGTGSCTVFSLRGDISGFNWITQINGPQTTSGSKIEALNTNRLAVTTSLGYDRATLMLLDNTQGDLLNVKEFTHPSERIRTTSIVPTNGGGLIVTGTQGTAYAKIFVSHFDGQGQLLNRLIYGDGLLRKAIKTANGLVLAGDHDVWQGSREGHIIRTNPDGSSCCEEESQVVDIDVPTYPFASITPLLPISSFQLTPSVFGTEEPFGRFEFICRDQTSARATRTTDPEETVSESGERAAVVRLFPNPATHTLCVSFKELMPNTSFRLISLSGQTLLKGMLDQPNKIIDVSKLDKGLYFMEVRHDRTRTFHKVVIE